MSGTPDHTPRRPDWVCRDCLRPWPCPERRELLVAEFASHPVSVALFLATCYQEASEHLAEVPAEVLYTRMLGWLSVARRPK